MNETELPRMRIARGRVMHVVEERGEGANAWYYSLCRRYRTRPNGPRRAYGAKSEWSAVDLGYPNCHLCPEDAK